MRVVFLDRDGVINRDREDFAKSWEEFEFLPGVKKALARLSRAGLCLVVLSNQSCVGRGLCSAETVDQINRRMLAELARAGAEVAGVYVCPHAPGEGCDCRKPRPGLILRAARELDLDLSQAVVIGDAARDLEAGAAAGVPGILVRTGKGRRTEGDPSIEPLIVVDDLAAAAEWLLDRAGR